MKNINNNRPFGWTTIDEGQSLVTNGLHHSTADMWYHTDYPNSYLDTEMRTGCKNEPCWSIGALFTEMARRDIMIETGTPVNRIVESSVNLLVDWLKEHKPSFKKQPVIDKPIEFPMENNEVETEECPSMEIVSEADDWHDIKGYEGIYAINRLGQVKRLTFTYKNASGEHTVKEHLVSPKKNKDYYFYWLTKNNRSRRFAADLLVADTFIPNPTGSKEIVYKDGNMSNYAASNLEWYMATENTEPETKEKPVETKKPENKGREVRIYATDEDGNVRYRFTGVRNAEKFMGVSNAMISKALKGKLKKAAGLYWHYETDEPVKTTGSSIEELLKPSQELIVKPDNKQSGRPYKKVYAKNKEGHVVHVFDSVTEAGKTLGIKPSGITNCINGRQRTAAGLFWSFNEPEANTEESKPTETLKQEPKRTKFNNPFGRKAKPVYALDDEGNVVGTFTSINAAARYMEVSGASISQALSGSRKYVKGFTWHYGTAESIEKNNAPIENKKPGKMEHRVYATKKNGRVVAMFDNVKHAAKAYKVSPQLISSAINGRVKTAVGLFWYRGVPEGDSVQPDDNRKTDKRSKKYREQTKAWKETMGSATELTLSDLTEQWKDIKGYKGLYQVSNLGEVKRLGSVNDFNGKSIKVEERIIALKDKDGYKSCQLAKDGTVKDHYVHCLVAKAFVPNPKKETVVSFKDGNRENCRAENLKWGKLTK